MKPQSSMSKRVVQVFRMAGSQSDEGQKLQLLRARLQETRALLEDIDEGTLTRFLQARSHNVDKALKFLLQHLKWTQTVKPLGYIQESEIPNEMKKEKVFFQGVDKSGRRIVVVSAARHVTSDRDLEEFKRFGVFALDKISSFAGDQDKFVMVADMKGFGYKNMDVKGFIACLEILQDHYPERLGKIYIVRFFSFFWVIWRIIYPFIDPNVREKITFVDDKLLTETLLKDIDITQLPVEYGGMLPLVPVQRADGNVKAS